MKTVRLRIKIDLHLYIKTVYQLFRTKLSAGEFIFYYLVSGYWLLSGRILDMEKVAGQ